MPYQPSEDVLAILSTLRASGMAWMAEEIESVVACGKELNEDNARLPWPSDQGLSEPYTDEEQERVALRFIRAYCVELFAVWSSAKDVLVEELQVEDVQLRDPGGNVGFQPFVGNYIERRGRLSSLIDKALG